MNRIKLPIRERIGNVPQFPVGVDAIVAEVASRDLTHPRHLCAKYHFHLNPPMYPPVRSLDQQQFVHVHCPLVYPGI
ncbi:hypothetical protein AgCh_013926 [Apium graveolens]